MAISEPVLVLTRPEPDSLSLLSEVRNRLKRDVPFVVSPVLKIRPLKPAVDLDKYRTVVFTSRNAVSSIGADLRNRSVVTVGARTAELAGSFGASATCLGDTVEDFLQNVSQIEAPAIHLRGVHSRGALAKNATEQGTHVDEAVVYDQVACDLSDDALEALLGGHAVVPIFSPRSSELISSNPCSPKTLVLAISAATAKAWRKEGQIIIAERPDRAAMLDLIASAF